MSDRMNKLEEIKGRLYGLHDESDYSDRVFVENAHKDVLWLLAEVERLRGALEPFGCAYHRLRYYSPISPAEDAALYASTCGSHLFELCNGIDGEPVRVSHLAAAHTALTEPPHE